MTDTQLQRMARAAGFDTFQKWVEYEHTQRRVEEYQFRIDATRLMWGEQAARQVKEELDKEREYENLHRNTRH